MWYITHTTSGASFYFTPGKKQYSVGRIADLELENDICVSRAHATFHSLQTDGKEYILLEDIGSKYGTFLNKEDMDKNSPLEKGHKVQLRNNDLVRFGRLQNVWKVQYVNFVTVTSAVSKEDALQVMKSIASVGGKVLNQWSSECTHLTMTDPSITVKLIHGLIDQACVVTPNYWKELANAVTSKPALELPKPELYRPSFEEKFDVGPRLNRRYLFKDLTFVFLCRKHFEMYSPIVRAAGGNCKEVNSGVQKAFLSKNNVVVIQYIASTQTQSSQTINDIAEILQTHSKRIIPEYEIGLAILHCSIKEFCNPLHNMLDTEVINTQTIDFEIPDTNENLITSTPNDNPANNHGDTQDFQETMPNMHITETPTEQGLKRKHTAAESQGSGDDDDLFQFGKKAREGESEPMVEEKSPPKPSRWTVRKSAFGEFLQKSQDLTSPTTEGEQNVSIRENRKRPYIQVLGEDEGGEDDLFSFGDTQTNKKRRSVNDNGDGLFDFKEKESENKQNEVGGEDSNDLQITEPFVVVSMAKKSNLTIKMPKPKILPRKISAVEWISGSLKKIKIKNESIENDSSASSIIKDEAEIKDENDIKNELTEDECKVAEEHRQWLNSLKDAVEIQKISLNNIQHSDKSHYRCGNNYNANAYLNGSARNYKTFVKKNQQQQQHPQMYSVQQHLH